MNSSLNRQVPPRWIGWYLIIVGLGIGGLWMASLPGAFDDGLFTYAGTDAVGNIPIFHVLAEGLMAAASLFAGVELLRRRPWAPGWALLANGMLAYSAINSSGWLLQNQPAVVVFTGATLVGSAVSAWSLLRRGRQSPETVET